MPRSQRSLGARTKTMKKSQTFKMLALVTAMVAFAACGTTATTPTTTSDTTSDTGKVIPSLPAGCSYTKPTTDMGCTGTDDKAWVTLANETTAVGDNFGDIVSDCTLKRGCLAQGDTCSSDADKATAKAICITNCIVRECETIPDSDPTSAKCAKVSLNCAWCYGRYSGECGFENCLSDCAVNSSSPACRDCLKKNCDGVRNDCKDGK